MKEKKVNELSPTKSTTAASSGSTSGSPSTQVIHENQLLNSTQQVQLTSQQSIYEEHQYLHQRELNMIAHYLNNSDNNSYGTPMMRHTSSVTDFVNTFNYSTTLENIASRIFN